MSLALILTGWLVAAAGLAATVITRLRLVRQTDAVESACHELRGPLTAVQLGLQFGTGGEPVARGRLRAITLELGRATLALDDLALVTGRERPAAATRLRAGAERLDLAEVVAASVEAWQAAASQHDARLRLHVPEGELAVWGVRLRLAQAVGNLISNAIEHGGGNVDVSAWAERGLVRLQVLDDGPGLPAPIGDLLARCRRSGRRARGDRGRGLGIVSAIAAGHGGRLAARPSQRGARLVLELPAASAADDGHAHGRPAGA